MRRGFSLIELLIVITIILIIIMVAIPNYIKSQMFAREMAAAKAVQTLQTAEIQYQAQYNHCGSLRELGPPEAGASGPASAGLISGALSSGTLGGYKFAVTATPETCAIAAVPAVFGASGVKSYYLDQNGALRSSDEHEPASAASPEYAH